MNPHFFSSPRQAAKQVRAIAAGLSAIDPAGAATYRANAEAFAQRLEQLANEFQAKVQSFPRRQVVTMHEVFDYLARDAGLEVVATIQAAPGHDPSAGQMRKVLEAMKKHHVACVLIEPQYSGRLGETIARDAKVPAYPLDPVASGPAGAGPVYYEEQMRKNLAMLERALGPR